MYQVYIYTYQDIFKNVKYFILFFSSRLSLTGSRTLLSAPSTESLTGSQHERRDGGESLIPAPTSTSKRASFIEVRHYEI
jgi:hypothetical protein